jgi:hypothetical protein
MGGDTDNPDIVDLEAEEEEDRRIEEVLRRQSEYEDMLRQE